MPKGRPFRPHEIGDILQHFRKFRDDAVPIMEAYQRTADRTGFSIQAVENVVKRNRPTTHAAREYLSANALKLAMRMVRNADVDQSIDILSRPNMNVLEPVKKVEAQSGFFMSVSVDTCGAVKVAGGQAQPVIDYRPAPELPSVQGVGEEPESVPEEAVGPVYGPQDSQTRKMIEASSYNKPGVPHPSSGSFLKSGRLAKAAAEARQRLEEKQAKRAENLARKLQKQAGISMNPVEA